jgi:4-amino-4-deoxy-L-arabinose transferase-like glycosyltransferase
MNELKQMKILGKDYNPSVIRLIVVGAVLRILSFVCSDNTGGDAFARLALTELWLRHPVFKISYDAYAPGHFWLIGLFTILFHNLEFAGRFLSLVLGIGSLYFVWRLSRTLYGDLSGLATLAIFVFYTLHIGYSTTSSAEVSYLFFLLAGLALSFACLSAPSRSLWRFAIAGLSLSIAETIRLEAWVISFGLGVLILILEFSERSSPEAPFAWFRAPLTFGMTAGAWPLFSLIYGAVRYHDPIRVLSEHNAAITGWFAGHSVSLGYELALFPAALLISLSPLAFVAAVYGFWKSWSFKLGASFSALMLFFAIVQEFEVISGKLLAMARYSMTLGAFLAVLAGFGFERLCNKLIGHARIRLVYSVLLALLAINLAIVFLLSEHPNRFSEKMASVSPRLRYPAHIWSAGHYLSNHLSGEDAVVIDDYNVESLLVAQAAGLPLEPGKRAYLAASRNPMNVVDYITDERPRFLVYSDRGTLRRWLPLPPACTTARIGADEYRCVFTNSVYTIYAIRYQ